MLGRNFFDPYRAWASPGARAWTVAGKSGPESFGLCCYVVPGFRQRISGDVRGFVGTGDVQRLRGMLGDSENPSVQGVICNGQLQPSRAFCSGASWEQGLNN